MVIAINAATVAMECWRAGSMSYTVVKGEIMEDVSVKNSRNATAVLATTRIVLRIVISFLEK